MKQKDNKNDLAQCGLIKDKFADFLTGELEQQEVDAVRVHTSQCTRCRDELEELTSLWTRMGVLPEVEPSPNLRNNFYDMLENYTEDLNKKNIFKRISNGLSQWFAGPRRPMVQMAFTVTLLIVGFTAGFYFSTSSSNSATGDKEDQVVNRLRTEVQQMRKELVLAMLDQPSPSNRLKAISWSSEVENPDNQTLNALLHTLNHDPNDNVRVSAAEALYLYIRNPIVKQGIIDSLPRQSSPMVQVALMDLIAAMREDKAVKALKSLLNNDKLNPTVKERAKTLMNFL